MPKISRGKAVGGRTPVDNRRLIAIAITELRHAFGPGAVIKRSNLPSDPLVRTIVEILPKGPASNQRQCGNVYRGRCRAQSVTVGGHGRQYGITWRRIRPN